MTAQLLEHKHDAGMMEPIAYVGCEESFDIWYGKCRGCDYEGYYDTECAHPQRDRLNELEERYA